MAKVKAKISGMSKLDEASVAITCESPSGDEYTVNVYSNEDGINVQIQNDSGDELESLDAEWEGLLE